VVRNKLLKSVFVRWLFGALVVGGILSVVLVLANKSLPKVALSQIAELTGAKVEAKSVDVSLNASVFIEELVIRPKQQSQYDNTILKADTVYAKFSFGSLLLLRPRLKEISVNGFIFDVQQDLDTGIWNLAALEITFPEGRAGKMPLIYLNSGVLQYSKVSNADATVAMALPIDAEFGAAEKGQDGYNFTLTTAQMGLFGKSILIGAWKPGVVTITGGISSEDIPAFEKAWKINVMAAELKYKQAGIYSLAVKITDFLYTNRPALERSVLVRPKFLDKLGPVAVLQRFYDRYRPAGRIDIEIEALGNLQNLAESKLKGKIYCKDVSICDRNFPYQIEHIVGGIDFTEKGISLNNLSGEHKDVELFFNGWSRDFGENRRYQYRIKSENMTLDDDLYSALSTEQKKTWAAFSPSGLAAVEYVSSRDPEADKKRTLSVHLLEIEAAYHRFPYPLKNLAGKLFFDDDSINLSNLVSQFDERKITINGKVTERKSDRQIYDVSIEANDIPLDSTLAEALTEGQKNLYNRFCLGGIADTKIRILTPQNIGPTTFAADVSFCETSLKVDKSEQVISDASGNAVFTPDSIRIESLRGKYADGVVSLAGHIWPPLKTDEQLRYCLEVDAQQVLLSDDLFSLIPEPLEKIVSQIQPAGKINYKAQLNKADDDECPVSKTIIKCLDNSINFKQFARPLKNITGTVIITEDSIELKSLAARVADDVRITPNSSTVEIDGRITLAYNKFKDGNFEIRAKDLLLDERLGELLPENFRTHYKKFSPSGRFDIDNTKISYTKDLTDGKKQVDFAGELKLKNCNLNIFPAITQLDVTLNITGLYKTGRGFKISKTALAADSLRIKGKSLKNLKADITYDRDNRSWTTKDLIADCYNGKMTGKFEFFQPAGEDLKYQLQTGFDNIDLEKFLSDTNAKQSSGKGYTQGQMSGTLSLDGRFGKSNERLGRCRLKITDMQVGEMSPLAKLLAVLKLTEPKDFAFEQMVVDSYIKQDKLFIEKFDLSGDSVAFKGTGWMDLQNQKVDLTLTARGRRLASDEPSVLQSLTDTLGLAVVRMEVGGNYNDPEVIMTTLPVIKDALGILGTEPLEND
jgi:hypothetical protein